MNGIAERFIKYLDGASKRFIIPVFQRGYDWKTEQCKRLYDDLVKMIASNLKSHFFGSIVSVQSEDGHQEEYLIIDGQQRLTTVSLLLLAMYRLLKSGAVVSSDRALMQRIYENYLVDKYAPDETRLKLKPIQNDREAFQRLFSEDQPLIPASKLTANYRYFYERIQRQEITVDQLFDAIFRLEIINITLNHDDNPQLIFESLNSTGLGLSEGDKIRNFILMDLSVSKQEKYYQLFWNPIERCVGYQTDLFIRDYLSVQKQGTPNLNHVYFAFKEYAEKLDREALLNELLSYARLYAVLLGAGSGDCVLDACIARLNRLETSVTRPFLLEALRKNREGKLSGADTRRIFCVVEAYLFRRMICDMPTNALNKIFLMLNREIVRLDGTDAQYAEKLIYTLTAKRERSRFPSDEEFIAAFVEKDIYQMNARGKAYFLERLENYGTLETKPIWQMLSEGVYTIEHIMPQHLTPAWRSALGDDYEAIHDKWLHKAANLTLTAYNAKYGNQPFEEKRDMKNGFRDSGIRMNQKIAQCEKWTLEELEARNAELSEKALAIWPYPETDYHPVEKQLDAITLDDETDMAGATIARFSFRGMEQPVSSWAEMYQKVLSILHSESKSVLYALLLNRDSEPDISSGLSDQEDAFKNAFRIDEGLYVSTKNSTQQKLNQLRRYFALYGVDASELIIYLRNENAALDQGDGSGRFGLRKRYWATLLPLLQEEFGEGGPFSNVHPGTSNWINGYVGLGGIHLTCVANLDNARVEFYFEAADANANKAIFDKLFMKRDAIEKRAGGTICWKRGNDQKSSKIMMELNDKGILDESAWPEMARFHARQCKRLYDAVWPEIIAQEA